MCVEKGIDPLVGGRNRKIYSMWRWRSDAGDVREPLKNRDCAHTLPLEEFDGLGDGLGSSLNNEGLHAAMRMRRDLMLKMRFWLGCRS